MCRGRDAGPTESVAEDLREPACDAAVRGDTRDKSVLMRPTVKNVDAVLTVVCGVTCAEIKY